MWQPREEQEELPNEPEVIEVNGKLMLLDQRYPSSTRGIVKTLEIVFCFVALLLVGVSHPVGNERGLPLFFASAGILVAFFLLLSYVLALNHRVASTPWFFMEVFLYVDMIVGLLCGAISMWIYSASHWSDVNPDWEATSAIASGALFICMGLYIVDLVLLLKNWKRWSWHPHVHAPEEHPQTSELPY